eukprot:4709623-Amphidinium_carterae.1
MTPAVWVIVCAGKVSVRKAGFSISPNVHGPISSAVLTFFRVSALLGLNCLDYRYSSTTRVYWTSIGPRLTGRDLCAHVLHHLHWTPVTGRGN